MEQAGPRTLQLHLRLQFSVSAIVPLFSEDSVSVQGHVRRPPQPIDTAAVRNPNRAEPAIE